MSQFPPDRPGFPSDYQGRRQPGPLPRYQLILLNDDKADLMAVVRTIMELTHFCRAEATHRMWQAHHSGRSILLMTHRERAELYVEQFAGKGITVKVEPPG
jgi:ATP-dependent Clp protease adaptor protein ClpS